MGGISTSVKNQDAMHTLKVKEGIEDDEYLITRHSQFVIPINVVNIYGEQEGRMDKDDILNCWNRIMADVLRIEAKNELVVICGDLNKHVGDAIEGNHSKITFGGKLIRDMLDTDKYVLVNSTNKVKGGPFTRYDPSDPNCNEKKSCLDLFIISKELFKHVEKLVIDENFTMTPCRPISRTKVMYPDHYASLLIFKNLPLKSKQKVGGPKFTIWNTNKEGGWENYKKLTEENPKLEEVAKDTSNDPDQMMNKLDKELNRIKYISFGKVKIRQKPKCNKELENLQNEKIKCFDDITEDNRTSKQEMRKSRLLTSRWLNISYSNRGGTLRKSSNQ